MKNLLLGFVLLFVTSIASADTTLLSVAPRIKLDAQQQKRFDREIKRKTTKSVQIAHLNIKDVVGGNGVLAFDVIIELNAKTKLRMTNCEVKEDAKYLSISWSDNNASSATFTIDKANGIVVGMIFLNTEPYAVESLGKNIAMIIAVDQTKFPSDENDTRVPPK